MSEPVSAGTAGGDSAPAQNGVADPKGPGSARTPTGTSSPGTGTPQKDEGSTAPGAASGTSGEKKPLAERKQARKEALKAEQAAARKPGKNSTTKGGAAPSAPQAKESPPGGEAPPSAAEKPPEAKEAEPKKESGLDALAKATLARRQLERDQQKFQDERKAWEEGPEKKELGTLKERLTKHEKLITLAEAGDIAGLVRHLGGENWRQTWFDLASGVVGDDPPPPTLTPEQVDERAKAAAKALIEEQRRQEQEERDRAEQTRVENMSRAINAYGQDIVDRVLASPEKYPHFHARHLIGRDKAGGARYRIDRERVETILREEYTNAGRKAPDPQVVLDRLEAEAKEIISKTLPAVAASPSEPSAGPGKTITPAMKAGATPPTESPRGTLKERLEARKARLRSEQQQRR
jgi:hypothetical protein